jgi:cell division protein FtsX
MMRTIRYVKSKEIRSNPAILWKENETIITSNGKPIAIVIRIENDLDIESNLAAFRQVKAMRAVEEMRLISKQKNLDKLSDKEIEEIIDEVRNEGSR